MSESTIIYHGSQLIIKEPIFGEGNPKNDYGLGFYCTHEIGLAKEWACTDESNGYANQYELNLTDLRVMHLSGRDYNILNWLALLLDNRTFRISSDIATEGKLYLLSNFLPDIEIYDIIIGYRANDSYFSFANAFLNNALSLAQLEKAMYLGKLGEQIVLKSKKSFKQIHFIRSEPADRETYYPVRNAKDQEARLLYRTERKKQRVADSIYLIDILRGEWNSDDTRIRRNVP
jgi:hypothetical protein